jgi:hypothetical protein
MDSSHRAGELATTGGGTVFGRLLVSTSEMDGVGDTKGLRGAGDGLGTCSGASHVAMSMKPFVVVGNSLLSLGGMSS